MTKKAIYTILAIILTAGLAVSGYYVYDQNKDDDKKEVEIVDYQTCKDNEGVLSGSFNETCTKEDQTYTRELTEEEKLAKIQTFEDCEKEEGAVIEESKCTIYGKEFTKEIVMLTYTNPDYPGFSFEYSSDWDVEFNEEKVNNSTYSTTVIKLIEDSSLLEITLYPTIGASGATQGVYKEGEVYRINDTFTRIILDNTYNYYKTGCKHRGDSDFPETYYSFGVGQVEISDEYTAVCWSPSNRIESDFQNSDGDVQFDYIGRVSIKLTGDLTKSVIEKADQIVNSIKR